ncbi:MAG: hypothetical protein JO250_03945 [Armatimonadetes bacterium]|nr:hypothetical protein [Armatimonadota bacterium]
MMVSVHAAVGAGVGARAKRPGAALAAGVISHLLCDLAPHRDYALPIEAPLALAVFLYLVGRYGPRSPQFWGAVGAVLPDAENALVIAGAFPQEKTIFPTHNEAAPWFLGHGRKVRSPLPQIILAALALWLAEKGRAM